MARAASATVDTLKWRSALAPAHSVGSWCRSRWWWGAAASWPVPPPPRFQEGGFTLMARGAFGAGRPSVKCSGLVDQLQKSAGWGAGWGAGQRRSRRDRG